MKVLQLYYKLPFPSKDGGAISQLELSKALLSDGIEVRVLAMKQIKESFDDNVAYRNFQKCTALEWVEIDNRIKIGDMLLSLFRRRSYLSSRFNSHAFEAALVRILKQEKFDVVMLEHLYLHWYIDVIRTFSNSRIVLRAQNSEVNLWSQNMKAEKNLIKKIILKVLTRRLLREEMRTLKKVDVTLSISDADKHLLKLECPDANIEKLQMPISERFRTHGPNMTEKGISFYHIGSMNWLPNARGVRWLLDEVYPCFLKVSSAAPIYFAGKDMPDWMLRYVSYNGNIRVVGEVEDALSFHSSHDVLLVPVKQSGGIRVKILEAMMMGNPVITSGPGAMGLDVIHGRELLIANDAAEFAQCMLRIISEPELRNQLAENAKKYVINHHSHLKVATSFREIISKLK